jgi:hypothetical protein
MAEPSSHMEVGAPEAPQVPIEVSAVPVAEAPARPTPRKLPNFPIDLHLPLVIYFPEDDDKIIVRSSFANCCSRSSNLTINIDQNTNRSLLMTFSRIH